MPQATVQHTEDGIVTVRVRRSSRYETLYRRNYDLQKHDVVEVKRIANNPHPVLIRILTPNR